MPCAAAASQTCAPQTGRQTDSMRKSLCERRDETTTTTTSKNERSPISRLTTCGAFLPRGFLPSLWHVCALFLLSSRARVGYANIICRSKRVESSPLYERHRCAEFRVVGKLILHLFVCVLVDWYFVFFFFSPFFAFFMVFVVDA